MLNKIPLPTDNLYKFVGLFSVALLISSFFLVIYATNSSNSVVFANLGELESLKALESPTPAESVRMTLLQKKIDVSVADRKTYAHLSGVMAALATLGMFVGFWFWVKRIQPLADQMAATQLEMARLQLLALKADLKAKGIDVDTP